MKILYILIAMSYFYYNCANGEMNRFERITLRELKQLLRVWTRYFQTLERQGLVTESDRRETDRLQRVVDQLERLHRHQGIRRTRATLFNRI